MTGGCSDWWRTPPRSAGGATRPAAREQAIRGVHGVTLWVDNGAPTELMLVETLGFRRARDRDGVRRFTVGDGGPGTFVDVRTVGGFIEGVSGVGTVHTSSSRCQTPPPRARCASGSPPPASIRRRWPIGTTSARSTSGSRAAFSTSWRPLPPIHLPRSAAELYVEGRHGRMQRAGV